MAKKEYPLLDENQMLKMLKTAISRQTANEVQAGAVLSVVDAYDRGVDRQTFLRILNEAVMLYDYLGCLSTVGRIQDIFAHNELTSDKITEGINAFATSSTVARDKLLEVVQLITEMPPSTATIH